MNLENSSFDNIQSQVITPENASSIFSLFYQNSQHTVYKVKIKNKWMFLKRIAEEHQNNPIYIDNLQREFEIGFTLDHPGIVTYFNLGKDDKGTYLLTEYIEGQMLREYLTNHKPTSEFIKNFINQLIDILSYLHQKNIYHLDLKPENLLISAKNQQLKLIDFGLAHSDSYSKIPSGTKNYASPEMFLAPESCNASSDIYSVGIILLEFFTGSTNTATLNNVPMKYRKIIEKCIQKKQHERFQNYEELKKVFFNIKRNRSIFFILSLFILLIFSLMFYRKSISKNYTSNQKIKVLQTLKNIKHSKEKTKKIESNKNHIIQIYNNTDSLTILTNEFYKNKLHENDSIFICSVKDSLAEKYIQKIKLKLVEHSFRAKKLIFNDLLREAINEFEIKFESLTQSYDKHSLKYFESVRVYSDQEKKLRNQLNVLKQ